MSGLLSASPVGVQDAHEYNRAIQVCNTDFYWTLVTSSYCVSYRRLAIKYNTAATTMLFVGRVCVPIDPAKVDDFDPSAVPTIRYTNCGVFSEIIT